MAHYDLREYMAGLEAAGELHRIKAEVDPHLEVGAIAQRLAERGGPAVHFTKVKGAAHGATLLGAMMGRGSGGLWSKTAVALDMAPSASHSEIAEEMLRRTESPIRALQVSGGLCKEVVVGGDDVDLGQLAAPYLHEGDGGACLTSWSMTVAQEPGGGHLAWDVLPLAVASGNTMTGVIPADSPVGRMFHEVYEKAGEPMPFAVVLGAVPVATMAAAFRLRRGDMSAVEIAGSLQREPLQLVKCETSDLLVPATAEMVIEGVVRPGERVDAGPFSGSFGYRVAGVEPGLVFEVRAITHRKEPILPFCPWGTPTSEIHIARGLDCDVQLTRAFEKRGAPVVKVFTPPWLTTSVVAVTTKVPYTAYAQSIAGLVRTTEATSKVPYILVCDDDIDITDPVSLFHAMVTKCHPDRDNWIVSHAQAAFDAPYVTAAERKLGKGAAAIFDCTWPLDWDPSIAVPPKVNFELSYPEELRTRIVREWSDGLGFPKESDRPV